MPNPCCVLYSGSRSGYIHHHDVRAAEHQVAALGGHSQEVCGLKWSPDGKYLASGGNDNLLNIWAAEAGQCYTGTSPVYTLTQHQAAVKVGALVTTLIVQFAIPLCKYDQELTD